MNAWLAIGLFLLGAGSGAFLTVIFYSAQVHRVRSEVQASEQTRAPAG
jgi:hypothetical protein